MPARFLPGTRAQMAALAVKLFARERLAHAGVSVFATPRRLVLSVKGLAAAQAPQEVVVLGPLKVQAFDGNGTPLPAANGFARKCGIRVKDLQERESEKGARMAYVAKEKGRPAEKVLPGLLAELAGSVEFSKSMRWPQSPFSFARPVRWLLALHGSRRIGVRAAGLTSADVTRGRRFAHPKPIKVRNPAHYFRAVRAAGIVVDTQVRKAAIRKEGDRLAARAGAKVLWDDCLLAEVADLVEAPAPVLCAYPAESLELPREVIVAAMQEHQRYFPLAGSEGGLVPRFVAVANGVDSRSVVAGNERVLKARLADATFFYRQDRNKPLAERALRLGEVVWQRNAGTLKDKCSRVSKLAGSLARNVGVDEAVCSRAGLLCKADLLTSMVGEFPSLQGVVGGIYASHDHEPAGVPEAIAEHYRPAAAGDSVPRTPAGAVVALADKLDSLAGHLGLGHAPTGTVDPFALRRTGIGILRILWEMGWKLSLTRLLRRAVERYAEGGIVLDEKPAIEGGRDFLRARLEAIFEEQGFQHDEIGASLIGFTREGEDDPVSAAKRLIGIAASRRRPGFREIVFALSRVTNIIPAGFEGAPINPDELVTPERKLHEAGERVREEAEKLSADGNYEKLFDLLATLKPEIDSFFDAVLVMDKDEAVRKRRLAVLKHVEKSIRLFGDLRKLVIE